AYDNAFEEAVGGGFGALRLRTCYEDDEDPDDERQRIKIEPIYDADSSVFFDLDAKRQDKADARCCFVLYSMTPEAYEEMYNDSPSSVMKEVEQAEFDWYTPDMVFVAEYYEIDDQSDYAITFTSVATGDEVKYRQSELEDDEKLSGELDPELSILAELEATGYKETRRKKVKAKKVHKYILSGNRILEDCGLIAGKCIPVVPVYGKRWFVDNIERCMGHVRLAKDAQRLKNMQLSKLAELSALSSTEKPIFNPEQMAGHAQMWSEDNLKNYPYLLVNAITGADGNPMPAGPLSYTKPPQIAPAMAALLQLTEVDMQSILGNQGEADKMVSNISGKAVEMIQTRMDMQTFIYVSNFAKSIRRVGEIWLSMAKDVYVESGRTMKTISPADDTGKVELMRPNADESGAVVYENDLSRASFDVAVDVGPSSASRREATVRSLIGLMQVSANDPETMQVLQAMAIMNMTGEGIQDVRDFFRKKLVRMGAVEPTEEEAQMLAAASQEKTPQDKALEAMAEEAQAKATKARTEVLETVANVELKKAQTLETEASMKLKEAQA
ncbi:MAG TPA: portal protein, partial [Dissulfurispiraceae bacterium]|nr:portal protein [Dissulfurispiraceae bacterium]